MFDGMLRFDEDDGAVDGILNGVWSVDCVWFGSAGLNTTVLDGEQARLMGALGMMKDGEEHMSDLGSILSALIDSTDGLRDLSSS